MLLWRNNTDTSNEKELTEACLEHHTAKQVHLQVFLVGCPVDTASANSLDATAFSGRAKPPDDDVQMGEDQPRDGDVQAAAASAANDALEQQPVA